ncbi:MAG: protein kinase [Myxococcales bacterium]|nr:protein kinase [Myxococcales bacterium]
MNALEQERGPLDPGQRFENFEIVGLLGSGGTAFVYEGYQEFLDRRVAIKVIPGKAEKAAEFRRRARAEAIVLSRIRHPNVVQVFDAGVTSDGALIYIIMERLIGRPLRDVLIALRALSVPEALVVGAQVCDAVEAAHRLGAIHRDLKPENIFIENGNHARVLDFGIAKFLDSGGFQTTDKYRWQGTPLYMSPEQLQGRQVTVRTDIYALGTLLYEALAGGHPCLNGIETPTHTELGWIQIGHVPPPLTELVPTIPDYVARVVQRAIAKAPENRYGSMHEFGIALRDAERRFTLEAERRRFATALRDLVGETNRARPGQAAFAGADTEQSPSLPPETTQEMLPPVVPPAALKNRDTVRLFALPSPGAGQGAPTPVVLERERIDAPPVAPAVVPARRAPAPSRASAAAPAPPPQPPQQLVGSPRKQAKPVSTARRPSPAARSKFEALAARALATPARAALVACVLGTAIAVPTSIGVNLAKRARQAKASPPASVVASSTVAPPVASGAPSPEPVPAPAALSAALPATSTRPASPAATAPTKAAPPATKGAELWFPVDSQRPKPAAVPPAEPINGDRSGADLPGEPINADPPRTARKPGGSAAGQQSPPHKALPGSGL